MTDESVRAVLRSEAQLVLIEAPAGCGKTHQGADYAREIAETPHAGRPLVLTHTHAACSAFASGTQGCSRRVEIRTIDSVIGGVAAAYHSGLGLPADVSSWIRARKDGHLQVAAKVAMLLERYPIISASLARRYPIVICDEHQDSSSDQHAVIMSLLQQGARVRIFSDPMQSIFRDKGTGSVDRQWSWDALKAAANAFEELDHPHRWSQGCAMLGRWTLDARAALKAGGRIDLRGPLPPSVTVVEAENQAQKNLEYRPSGAARKTIDQFEKSASSLLTLTRHNDTARSMRSLFYRRIPLWEGHTRIALEALVQAIDQDVGHPEALAAAVASFLSDIGTGFGASAFGIPLHQEATEACAKQRRGRPAQIQELARFLVLEPNHRRPPAFSSTAV